MKQIVSILILVMMNGTAFSQTWLDTTLYPFESKFLQLEAGGMHYVDEGEGENHAWKMLLEDILTEGKGLVCHRHQGRQGHTQSQIRMSIWEAGRAKPHCQELTVRRVVCINLRCQLCDFTCSFGEVAQKEFQVRWVHGKCCWQQMMLVSRHCYLAYRCVCLCDPFVPMVFRPLYW